MMAAAAPPSSPRQKLHDGCSGRASNRHAADRTAPGFSKTYANSSTVSGVENTKQKRASTSKSERVANWPQDRQAYFWSGFFSDSFSNHQVSFGSSFHWPSKNPAQTGLLVLVPSLSLSRS